MPNKSVANLEFPLAGLDRRLGFQKQPPFTTPDCLNVRPVNAKDGRTRGGLRPGIVKHSQTQLVGDYPVRMLGQVRAYNLDNPTRTFSDHFIGTAGTIDATSWSIESGSVLGLPTLESDGTTANNYGAPGPTGTVWKAAILKDIDLDSTADFSVLLSVHREGGAGTNLSTVQFYWALDDTDPQTQGNSLCVEIAPLALGGEFDSAVATLRRLASGSAAESSTANFSITGVGPYAFTLLYDASAKTATLSMDGTILLSKTFVSVPTGSRMGFRLYSAWAGGSLHGSKIDRLAVAYATTLATLSGYSYLTAVGGNASGSDGVFYADNGIGEFNAFDATTPTREARVSGDRLILGTDRLSKFYVSDWGEIAQESDLGGAISGGTYKILDDATVSDWTALGINKEDHVIVITSTGATGRAVVGVYHIDTISAGSITALTAMASGDETTVGYRIERALKVYDPAAETFTLAQHTAGIQPTNCSLIALYRDRIVLAGDPQYPHVWYMSRSGTPTDWDYSQTDSRAAAYGANSDAGQIADPITALIPGGDDYMLFGCANSLWVMRGDPAYSASIDPLSRVIGVVSAKAWCNLPDGSIMFASNDGIYALAPGAASIPQPISKDRVPRELTNFRSGDEVTMVYDSIHNGVHIFVYSEDRTNTHYWLDLTVGGFWPVSLEDEYTPTCAIELYDRTIDDSAVVFGCRDGYLRRFTKAASDDDGIAFLSHVLYGPVRAGDSDYMDGIVDELDATLGTGSGDVRWELLTGEVAEDAVNGSVFTGYLLKETGDNVLLETGGLACTDGASDKAGIWSEGRNYKNRPAARAPAFVVKLSGIAGEPAWMIEGLTVARRTSGPQRLL